MVRIDGSVTMKEKMIRVETVMEEVKSKMNHIEKSLKWQVTKKLFFCRIKDINIKKCFGMQHVSSDPQSLVIQRLLMLGVEPEDA